MAKRVPLPEPPPSLSEAAQKRWRAVLPRLARRGEVDLERLETYCQVWARWRETEAAIGKTGTLVRKETGGAGVNPLIGVSHSSAREVRALEQQLGLGREARPRAAPGGPMSLRQYARRRGVSVEAVSKAISAQRLVRSVLDVGGRPKIGDPELADREWLANTDLSRAPLDQRGVAGADPNGSHTDPRSDVPSIADSSAREKHFTAGLKELQYRTRAGELVNAAAVKAEFEAAVKSASTKFRNVPRRFRFARPHQTDDDIAALEALIDEVLTDLAGGAEERA